MRTYEKFESIAIEARKSLYDIFVELTKFQEANTEHREIDGVYNFYMWRYEQEQMICEHKIIKMLYLEAWSKGDFRLCEIYADDIEKIEKPDESQLNK